MRAGTPVAPLAVLLCTTLLAAPAAGETAAGSFSLVPFEGRFGVAVGLNAPIGAFTAQDQPVKTTGAGFAGPGPAAAVRGEVLFGTSGLGLVLDISFLAATVDKPAIEEAIRSERAALRETRVEADASSWWLCVPVTAGARLGFSAERGVEFYGLGLFGVALLKMPDLHIDSEAGTLDYEHEGAAAACLAGEAGVVFTHTTVGVRLFAAPSPRIGARETVSLDNNEFTDDYRRANPFQSLLLFVGYRF